MNMQSLKGCGFSRAAKFLHFEFRVRVYTQVEAPGFSPVADVRWQRGL
jgi:hypothetical protein